MYTILSPNECLNLLRAAHPHFEIYMEKRDELSLLWRRKIIISKEIDNFKLGEYDFSEPLNDHFTESITSYFRRNSLHPENYQEEKFKLVYESYYDSFSKKFALFVKVILELKDFILMIFPNAKIKVKEKSKSGEVILKIKNLGKPVV